MPNHLPSRSVRFGFAVSLVGAIALASPVAARPAAAPRTRISSEVLDLAAATAHADPTVVQRLSQRAHARWDGDRLELQLHLQPGTVPESVTDASLAAFGGRAGVRGLDMMDAWLPPQRLSAFLRAHPQVAFAQLPWRGVPTVGPNQSEGATILRPAQTECLGADGAGATVAVLDAGFQDLDKSMAAGELPEVLGNVAQTGGAHGTMCAEVVADVAPGARILPVMGGSFSAVQNLAKKIVNGNPDTIEIVSHSVIWLGMGFGRHEGPACAVTDLVRSAGVAWVNAAGNSSGGQFYKAQFVDADKDGLHDFQPGEPHLIFVQGHGGAIQLSLDWDDYELRTQNFDLALYRLGEGGKWELVDSSRHEHGPYQPPYETIQIDNPGPGVYGAVVEAKKGTKSGTWMRLINLGGGGSTFSVWHNNGNIYDPASCDHVLTVGAIYHGHYDKGPLEGYSSYGPTPDGRLKPEVMAPTGVKTSQGAFFGTSAACPHAAGLLAVYARSMGLPALEALPYMVADAVPMGDADPDDSYGNGRLVLGLSTLGWQCDAGMAPPEDATCTTACGTVGKPVCGTGCTWSECALPLEVCNGLDDDCDGLTDELDTCAAAPDAGDTVDDAGPDGDGLAQDLAAETTPVTSTQPTLAGGGCQASPAAPRNGLWLLGILALWMLVRRRLVHPAKTRPAAAR
jgi:hypothetical protein